MPIKYRLVLRKDMTKGAAAGSKLYYAVNKSTGTCDFEELCDQIADRSTASRGDVHVVMDGLLYILKQRLQKGETIQLGDLGHFQAVIGSKGTKLESDFNTSLIKRPRIIFRPSVVLKNTTNLIKFEKIIPDAPGHREEATVSPLTKSEKFPRAPLDEKRCTPADGATRSVGGDAIRTPPAAPSTSR